MDNSYDDLKLSDSLENPIVSSFNNSGNEEFVNENETFFNEDEIKFIDKYDSFLNKIHSSEQFSKNLQFDNDFVKDHKVKSENEKDLVESARNGDSLAITLLVVEYHRFLDKYVGLLNIPISYKEDFIQEGLIGLLKAVRTFDSKLGFSFSTYATRCIKNAVISELRKHNHREISKEISFSNYPDGIDGILDSVAYQAVSSPENEYINMESSSQLHDTIFSVLSTYEAEVFEMYLAETPYSQIAMRLGKDVKSIDNAIQRIKNKLKKLV